MKPIMPKAHLSLAEDFLASRDRKGERNSHQEESLSLCWILINKTGSAFIAHRMLELF